MIRIHSQFREHLKTYVFKLIRVIISNTFKHFNFKHFTRIINSSDHRRI